MTLQSFRRSCVSLAWCASALVIACSGDRVSGAPPGAAEVAGVPMGWYAYPGTAFSVGLDHTNRHSGSAAAYMTGLGSSASASLTMEQDFLAYAYRGKRVRWSAWVQQADVHGTNVGLFMNVEGPGQVTAATDMSDHALGGTADWHQVSVVVDVAPNSIGLSVGVMMSGSGTLRIDDARLEVVGADVPSTNALTEPVATSQDSAAVATEYSLGGSGPVNLDFEGFAPAPQSAIGWLSTNAIQLTTTDPSESLTDLAPLEQMIGSAHLVGLGEGTHGTREFFRIKHRIVEALVKDMGFTVFAIEATSPEANDMNHYVLTGEGDPKVLLSRLYFWTWNTQEVLDMVQWMRSWNAAAPPSQRVQFLGFDMQFPGESMDTLQAFAAHISAADSAFVALRFNCMNPYRNRGPNPPDLYISFYLGKVSAADRAACAAGLQEIYDLIATEITRSPNAASPDTYQLRLHDARLVQQYEHMLTLTGETSYLARDESMAENIGWIRDHVRPNAKVVLWAHDGHINSIPEFMGGYLRSAYGTDYVNLGFLFGTGTFNSVGLNGGGLKAWSTTFIPSNSIEAIFSGAGKSELLLDTRRIASGGAAASTLRGPIEMRSIGSGYDQGAPAAFFSPVSFPDAFDLLIYVQSTTASTLLPFVYQ